MNENPLMVILGVGRLPLNVFLKRNCLVVIFANEAEHLGEPLWRGIARKVCNRVAVLIEKKDCGISRNPKLMSKARFGVTISLERQDSVGFRIQFDRDEILFDEVDDVIIGEDVGVHLFAPRTPIGIYIDKNFLPGILRKSGAFIEGLPLDAGCRYSADWLSGCKICQSENSHKDQETGGISEIEGFQFLEVHSDGNNIRIAEPFGKGNVSVVQLDKRIMDS